MAKLDRDGVKIHYEIHGSGPTLLLSHGYSSTARMWDGQIAALKDRYQVVVWDMRGHGESDYPADQNLYSEALTVGDMKALLNGVIAAQKEAEANLIKRREETAAALKPGMLVMATATPGDGGVLQSGFVTVEVPNAKPVRIPD